MKHMAFRSIGGTVAAAACVLALPAAASEISFQTRNSAATALGVGAAAIQATVEALTAVAPTAGYCDRQPGAWQGLSNQVSCASAVQGDIAFDISAAFGVGAAMAGTWNFRVGPDFGRGGALFVDGVQVDFDTNDLWWDGDFGATTQLLTATVNLAAGNHVIEAYGFEGCCDGAQEAQWMSPGSAQWVTFSRQDGLDLLQEVPEPATALLLVGALGALRAGTRRRRA